MNQAPTSDSSPEGSLADYRRAGLQHVLSECKLNAGAGPASPLDTSPPPRPWLGPSGLGGSTCAQRRAPVCREAKSSVQGSRVLSLPDAARKRFL